MFSHPGYAAWPEFDNPGNRGVLGQNKTNNRNVEGGKVAGRGDRRHPDERNPRRPVHPRKPIHPVIVGIPSGTGAAVASGGVPPRLTGPSGGGGGSRKEA